MRTPLKWSSPVGVSRPPTTEFANILKHKKKKPNAKLGFFRALVFGFMRPVIRLIPALRLMLRITDRGGEMGIFFSLRTPLKIGQPLWGFQAANRGFEMFGSTKRKPKFKARYNFVRARFRIHEARYSFDSRPPAYAANNR